MKEYEFISEHLEFSRTEIEALAKKLDSISHLSEREQKLLLAVFTAARDNVTVPGEPPVQKFANLAEAIINSFVPNLSKDYLITCRIGTGPIIHGGPTKTQ
jgi:hypothetical protein